MEENINILGKVRTLGSGTKYISINFELCKVKGIEEGDFLELTGRLLKANEIERDTKPLDDGKNRNLTTF